MNQNIINFIIKKKPMANKWHGGHYFFLKALAGPLILLIISCSNSEIVSSSNNEDIAYYSSNKSASNADSFQEVLSSNVIDYLPIDDSEYPYASIPRIVIETENHREIKDRETEIPAKLQIWGEKSPESEIMELTIRGRGNSSWSTPKKSYKIEFSQKKAILGMPKDKDWALIANYADKTLMKNHLIYHLSANLGVYYAPQCKFAELYLNNEYLGVYLVTETIKIAKNRINIPEDEFSFVVEVDQKYRDDEQVVFSHIIQNTEQGKPFKIHSPKNASTQTLKKIETHICEFEMFLKSIRREQNNNLAQWIDINEYIKHYWIQEFSKNTDAAFNTSVFFSWIQGDVIKMGPVWDFDVSFGGYANKGSDLSQNWYIKNYYWNSYIFRDSLINQVNQQFWRENRKNFSSILQNIDSLHSFLQKAAQNNFRKWDILSSTEHRLHLNSYNSYDEAVSDLKKWITERLLWINSQFEFPE